LRGLTTAQIGDRRLWSFGGPSAYEQPIPDRHRRQAINAWLTSDQAEIGTPKRATPKPSRKVSLFARSPSSRPI